MFTYQLFEGLDVDSLQVTLDEYTRASEWRVHTIGNNEDGFWILLERPR